MIAVRLLSREEWQRKLRNQGCYPQEGLTPLNTAEWWRWPFPGSPFTVPVNEDGSMDIWAYQRLMSEMARSAPNGWPLDDPYNDPGG